MNPGEQLSNPGRRRPGARSALPVLVLVAAALGGGVGAASARPAGPPAVAPAVVGAVDGGSAAAVEAPGEVDAGGSERPAAEPAGPVSGEAAPAPVVGQELLERRAPGGAVVHLDDEGLLVLPGGAVDGAAVRGTVCAQDVPDRPRHTVDVDGVSAASALALDQALAVLGCDVTGFRLEVDGASASLVVGAASVDAERRLRAVAADLAPQIVVEVVLDIDERG